MAILNFQTLDLANFVQDVVKPHAHYYTACYSMHALAMLMLTAKGNTCESNVKVK